MAGLCRGSALRSRIRPRLPTYTSVTSSERARLARVGEAAAESGMGSTCHCMSGAGSEGQCG